MKVLLIAPWDIKCGISLYTENVYREIVAQGHDVIILSETADERNRRFEVTEDGVIRCWRRGEHWRYLLELASGFRDREIVNIQHEMSYCWEPHLWHQLLSGLHEHGLPVVVTYHTIPYAMSAITDNPEADGVIVCNPKARDAMIRRGWAADRIWRIQHGVLSSYSSPKRRPLGRLAIYGFLAGQKGYSETMEAMERLLPGHPNLCLTIFGSLSEHIKDRQEAYYYDNLRREIVSRGLQDRVTVLMGFPHQKMLHTLLADHDILVLYYNMGAAGYCESGALHTGLATGRPVIVSDAHHFDCSPDMESALLRAGSVSSLSALIDRLLSDSDFYVKCCRNVRNFAKSRPIQRAAREYVEVFNTVSGKYQYSRPNPSRLSLIGAIIFSRGRRPLLNRALNSLVESSPEIPIVVVDTAGRWESLRNMGGEWDNISYLCTEGRSSFESLRIGIETLPALYAKIVNEEDIMLTGWFEEHARQCRRNSPLVWCNGLTLSANSKLSPLDNEVVISSQLCIHRDVIATMGGLEGIDVESQTAAWFKCITDGGYIPSHIPISCFVRDSLSIA